jgi:hypothetical protein
MIPSQAPTKNKPILAYLAATIPNTNPAIAETAKKNP